MCFVVLSQKFWRSTDYNVVTIYGNNWLLHEFQYTSNTRVCIKNKMTPLFFVSVILATLPVYKLQSYIRGLVNGCYFFNPLFVLFAFLVFAYGPTKQCSLLCAVFSVTFWKRHLVVARLLSIYTILPINVRGIVDNWSILYNIMNSTPVSVSTTFLYFTRKLR